MEIFSTLLALCVGNSPVTGEFPSQSPVMWSFGLFFIWAWIKGWVNNSDASDLRCYCTQYDVTVMIAHYIEAAQCANMFMILEIHYWCHMPELLACTFMTVLCISMTIFTNWSEESRWCKNIKSLLWYGNIFQPFVWGIHQLLMNIPHNELIIQSFDVFFTVWLIKLLNKQ